MKIKHLAIALATLGTAGLLSTAAYADMPGHHPGYLHALTDLRDARWALETRPGDRFVRQQEDVAVIEIDRAINEAKTAAMEDGKNLRSRPPEDARIDRRGRLRQADEFLRKARADVAQEEDNPEARGLRNRVVSHIDAAIAATDRAIVEAGR